MSDYWSVRFCSCGRIHILPSSCFDWLQEKYQSRKIIQVCQGCGATYSTYLDEYEDGYCICGEDLENIAICGDPDKIVFINQGFKVPVVDGWYADYHNGSNWFSEGKKVEVDTQRLIRDISDWAKQNNIENVDIILKSIAGYVSGINWKGTKYEIGGRG